MEKNTHSDEEMLMIDETTDSKPLRKSSRTSKQRFFILSEGDFETEQGGNDDTFSENDEETPPYDDIDTFLNDGSEENTNISNTDDFEKEEYMVIQEKTKAKPSKNNKTSKKRNNSPSESENDSISNENDYEFIEENNEEVEDNINYGEDDDSQAEEVVIKGEPVTEDFEEEEFDLNSESNQTKIKTSHKGQTVKDISHSNEPEIHTEIDEEEGEFFYENSSDAVQEEDYDAINSSNNILIENSFTETVKSEKFTDSNDNIEDGEENGQENQSDLQDNFSYEEDIKIEEYEETQENIVSAIKISLKDKTVTNLSKSKDKLFKKKRRKEKESDNLQSEEQIEIKTENIDEYSCIADPPTTIKISLKDKTVTNIPRLVDKDKNHKSKQTKNETNNITDPSIDIKTEKPDPNDPTLSPIKISLKNRTVTNIINTTKTEIKIEKNPDEIEDDVAYEEEYIEDAEYIEEETGFENEEGEENDESMEYDFEDLEQTIDYSEQNNGLSDMTYAGDTEINMFLPSKDVKTPKKVSFNLLLHREDPERLSENVTEKKIRDPNDLTKSDCCYDNPNFAVIIDFIEKFGEDLGIKNIPMKRLQTMLRDRREIVHPDLIQLHSVLLRKIKLPKRYSITKKTWEKALVLFCNGAGAMIHEGMDLKNLGYSSLNVNVKLEILRGLLEAQFEWNENLRKVIDDLPTEALRNEPTGRDIEGNLYWTQIDDQADIRIYAEDVNHQAWENIVQNRVQLVELLKKLKENTMYEENIETIKEKEGNAIFQNLKQEKVEVYNTDNKCEICGTQTGSKFSMLEHYSEEHMRADLKEKFKSLVSKLQCKICKFEAEEDEEIWDHIGTLHEKVNIILKEKGFMQVADIKELEAAKALEEEKKRQIQMLKEKENPTKELEYNLDYVCEICDDTSYHGTKVAMLEHYSRYHMEPDLRELFSHLVNEGLCDLCKFANTNETEIFVHIGTFHEKVNLLLKEKGLKQVGDNPNAPKATVQNPVITQDNLQNSNLNETEQHKLVESIPTIHEEFDLPFELPTDILDTIIKIGQQIENEEPVEPFTANVHSDTNAVDSSIELEKGKNIHNELNEVLAPEEKGLTILDNNPNVKATVQNQAANVVEENVKNEHPKIMNKNNSVDVFNTEYKCEVCSTEMQSRLVLMEHYSADHMEAALKQKFIHLIKDGLCQICKFEPEEEDDLWVHIGATHEKVNDVLKENGLKPVGDKQKSGGVPNNVVDAIDELEKEENRILSSVNEVLEESGAQPISEGNVSNSLGNLSNETQREKDSTIQVPNEITDAIPQLQKENTEMEVQNTIVAVISEIEKENEAKSEHLNQKSFEKVHTTHEKEYVEKEYNEQLNHENSFKINERNLEIEADHDIHIQPCVTKDTDKGEQNTKTQIESEKINQYHANDMGKEGGNEIQNISNDLLEIDGLGSDSEETLKCLENILQKENETVTKDNLFQFEVLDQGKNKCENLSFTLSLPSNSEEEKKTVENVDVHLPQNKTVSKQNDEEKNVVTAKENLKDGNEISHRRSGRRKLSQNSKLSNEMTKKESCKNETNTVSDKDDMDLKEKTKKFPEDENSVEVTKNKKIMNKTQDSYVRVDNEIEKHEFEEGNRRLRKKRACAEKTEILKAATTTPKKTKMATAANQHQNNTNEKVDSVNDGSMEKIEMGTQKEDQEKEGRVKHKNLRSKNKTKTGKDNKEDINAKLSNAKGKKNKKTLEPDDVSEDKKKPNKKNMKKKGSKMSDKDLKNKENEIKDKKGKKNEKDIKKGKGRKKEKDTKGKSSEKDSKEPILSKEKINQGESKKQRGMTSTKHKKENKTDKEEGNKTKSEDSKTINTNKKFVKKKVQWVTEIVKDSGDDTTSKDTNKKKNFVKGKKENNKSKKTKKATKINSKDLDVLDVELLKKICIQNLRVRASKGRMGLKRKQKDKKSEVYNAIAIFLKATRFRFENLLHGRVIGKGEFNVKNKSNENSEQTQTNTNLKSVPGTNNFINGRKRGFHLFNMPPWYSTTEEEDSEEEQKTKLSKLISSRGKRKGVETPQEILKPRKRTKTKDILHSQLTNEDSDSDDEDKKVSVKKVFNNRTDAEKGEAKKLIVDPPPQADSASRPRRATAKAKKAKKVQYTYDDSSEFDDDEDAYESFEGDDDSDDDFDGEFEYKLSKARPQKRLPARQARNKKNPKLKDFEEEEEEDEEEEHRENQLDFFDFDCLKLEEGSGEEEEEEEEDNQEDDIGLSCIKCNEFKKEDERIYVCKNCTFGWHQYCSIPPLYHKPKKNWLCPLCSHISLVQNLEQTLEELDILIEKEEERRLTALIEKSYRESDDSYDEFDSIHAPKVRISVQNWPPEIKDYKRKTYFEEPSSSSSEWSSDESEEDFPKAHSSTCTCTDADEELCLFCKKLQGQLINQYIQSNFFYSLSKSKGCTCKNTGTCRSCMSKMKEESKKDDPRSLPKMSTTELFLLTGKARKVEVEPHERSPDDGFRYRGTARGRGAVRKARRPRGSRGSGRGISRGLPPGITVLNSDGIEIENKQKKPRGRGTNVGARIRKRGANVVNGMRPINVTQEPNNIVQSQYQPKLIQPKIRGNLPRGRGLNRGMLSNRGQVPLISSRGRPPRGRAVVNRPTEPDVIDIDIDDDDADIAPQHVIHPHNPSQMNHRTIAPSSRGGMIPTQNIHQRGPVPVRPVHPKIAPVPFQRGKQIPNQIGAAPSLRGVSPQRGVPFRRGVSPQRGVPLQRGAPQQRGITHPRGVPVNRKHSVHGGFPLQRGIPSNRGVSMQNVNSLKRGVAVQRGSLAPRGMNMNQNSLVKRGVPTQRGVYPVLARGSMPRARSNNPLQRNANTAPPIRQRAPPPQPARYATSQRSLRPVQRGVYPTQRASRMYSPSAPRGMAPIRQPVVPQRRPVMRGRGRPVSVTPRPRMPVIRQPQRGMIRGQQPHTSRRAMRTRVRGQRMPFNQQFSGHQHKESYNGDDIIIPTLNPGYQSAPDFDIIADDEIQMYETEQDDNIMSSRPMNRSREEEANLARLPQYIQIQKVVEHEVLDID